MNIPDIVAESAKFYGSNMLDIDYKQTEFCYRSLKEYFKGSIACELGPSTGYMTKLLLNDFDELDVVEGAHDLLNQIPSHQKLKKYHSLFEEFTPERKYHTIIMNHVLEHIEKPVRLLEKLSTWLTDAGVLLVGVPNAKSLHRMVAVQMGLLKSEYELNSRDHELGHYRVYDMDTLKSHLITAGFTIQETGGVFLKPLSNSQIEKNWNEGMIEGFYKIGKMFPKNCAEIFAIATI
jgi:trans-aconitate methyltransferase